MKRLLERLQPLKAAVKSIFFISITVLVVIELVRLKRTITLESLESALAGLSIWHLVLMAIIGLVAVSPMLFYDIILNKELETDYSKSYILETSWAVNTINNLAGFAGLIGLWDSLGGFSVAIFTVSFLMVVVGLWLSPAEEVNVPPSGAKKPTGKVKGVKPKPSKTAKPASDKADTVDTEPTVPLLYDGLEKTVPLPANYRFDMAK